MLYQRKTFTCPAAPQRTSQRSWDYSVLSKGEFIAKYGPNAEEYATNADSIRQ